MFDCVSLGLGNWCAGENYTGAGGCVHWLHQWTEKSPLTLVINMTLSHPWFLIFLQRTCWTINKLVWRVLILSTHPISRADGHNFLIGQGCTQCSNQSYSFKMNVRSYHSSVINPPMVLILVKSRPSLQQPASPYSLWFLSYQSSLVPYHSPSCPLAPFTLLQAVTRVSAFAVSFTYNTLP